ncbi:MAG: DUF1349 domain-containing protein [Anaerolineales bacterium]|nr:DUF1349 domain-containing protein [Anaerolineales bacterium]
MNTFNHSENDAIKKLLEETAQKIEPSFAFTAQLEKHLKQTHKPKAGINMSNIKKITSPIGWAFALVVLAIAFNWIASQIAPKNIPATNIPEVVVTESTPSPSPTIVESSPTPTAPTFVTLPTSTALPFRDDFDGPLDKDWEWLREKDSDWSLTNNPGWLEIIAGFGLINGGNMNNLLLQPVPEGNFELETKLKFKPTEEMEFAGLLIYENAANHIQFGHAFCHAPSCTGDGIYFENMVRGSWNVENFEFEADNLEIVYLRLRREGNNFTAYISQNGEDWQLIGTHITEMNPLSVGLISGQSFDRDGQNPAQFDYFIINSLP